MTQLSKLCLLRGIVAGKIPILNGTRVAAKKQLENSLSVTKALFQIFHYAATHLAFEISRVSVLYKHAKALIHPFRMILVIGSFDQANLLDLHGFTIRLKDRLWHAPTQLPLADNVVVERRTQAESGMLASPSGLVWKRMTFFLFQS